MSALLRFREELELFRAVNCGAQPSFAVCRLEMLREMLLECLNCAHVAYARNPTGDFKFYGVRTTACESLQSDVMFQ